MRILQNFAVLLQLVWIKSQRLGSESTFFPTTPYIAHKLVKLQCIYTSLLTDSLYKQAKQSDPYLIFELLITKIKVVISVLQQVAAFRMNFVSSINKTQIIKHQNSQHLQLTCTHIYRTRFCVFFMLEVSDLWCPLNKFIYIEELHNSIPVNEIV